MRKSLLAVVRSAVLKNQHTGRRAPEGAAMAGLSVLLLLTLALPREQRAAVPDVRELLVAARGVAPALCALAADGVSTGGWGGGWGAWEIAARYSDLDLNWHEGAIGETPAQAPVGGVRGGDEKIWTFGLNWYLNNNVLMRLNYLIVDVNKLGFVTSGSSTTLQQVGQKFSAFGARLQFTN